MNEKEKKEEAIRWLNLFKVMVSKEANFAFNVTSLEVNLQNSLDYLIESLKEEKYENTI